MKNVASSLVLSAGLMAAAFLLCAGVAWFHADPFACLTNFLTLSLACLALLAVAWRSARTHVELRRKDAIATVFFSWLFCGMLGSLPYLVFDICGDPASALFESFSGLTTTGASVLTNLESLPRSILFWRSLTHFLGGIGILIMFIAILPFVGAGGVQLYKAESSGVFGEKLAARIADTARIIVGVYLLLNLACALALRLAGLSWFDAVCHAFATIATGGFSTRTDSIAAFQSPAVEWIVIVFMFVSGMNFVAHFRALKGQPRYYLASSELRLYAGLALGTSLLAAALLLLRDGGNAYATLRTATFQTVSLYTTTGFVTADYDLWPALIRVLFLLLMVVGACSGSTSGALKTARLAISVKLAARQSYKVMFPAVVKTVKFDGAPVDDSRAIKALGYLFAYLMAIGLFSILMRPFTPDAMTALSSVVACIGGVGPGMSAAGPMETFADFPAIAKGLLIACMVLGRLEIFACIAVFSPQFWRQ